MLLSLNCREETEPVKEIVPVKKVNTALMAIQAQYPNCQIFKIPDYMSEGYAYAKNNYIVIDSTRIRFINARDGGWSTWEIYEDVLIKDMR